MCRVLLQLSGEQSLCSDSWCRPQISKENNCRHQLIKLMYQIYRDIPKSRKHTIIRYECSTNSQYQFLQVPENFLILLSFTNAFTPS